MPSSWSSIPLESSGRTTPPTSRGLASIRMRRRRRKKAVASVHPPVRQSRCIALPALICLRARHPPALTLMGPAKRRPHHRRVTDRGRSILPCRLFDRCCAASVTEDIDERTQKTRPPPFPRRMCFPGETSSSPSPLRHIVRLKARPHRARHPQPAAAIRTGRSRPDDPPMPLSRGSGRTMTRPSALQLHPARTTPGARATPYRHAARHVSPGKPSRRVSPGKHGVRR